MQINTDRSNIHYYVLEAKEGVATEQQKYAALRRIELLKQETLITSVAFTKRCKEIRISLMFFAAIYS